MKERCKVVMLPTKKASSIYVSKHNNKIHSVDLPEELLLVNNVDTLIFQHLYLVSDEEIKVGDWAIDNWRKSGYTLVRVLGKEHIKNLLKRKAKKVIATTDSLLGEVIYGTPGGFNQLPQIPEDFVQAYATVNGKIGEVMVEYDAYGDFTKRSPLEYWKERLKLNDDNTVIISRVESGGIEFTAQKIRDFYIDLDDSWDEVQVDKWIKENLK